ncbi:MAG: hypothetical protein H0U00_08740 [Actinobacteria bacterium]|nr:hypothetical protein [Actinomycetota bacterium]
MKSLLAGLVVAIALVGAGGAVANGSPYSPGLVYGWAGVGAESNAVRFVAFGMPKSTIVAAVRARDGRVVRSAVVRGFYGVPLVAYDGTSGGLSGDGRWLVLSSYGPQPGTAGKTSFVILSTKTLKPRLPVVLAGSWSFDAVSPSGSTLYLVEHISVDPSPRYRVRTLDVASGRLGGAIVDRLENEEVMGGEPVTRATSAGGRWAYTLYAREKNVPFVHALDTVRREAFCIDIPLDLAAQKQTALRLKLAGGSLNVRMGRDSLATIDTASFRVRRT